MADITVAELAKEIGTPVDRLVSQLADSKRSLVRAP
jgi:translation initiation factor IF-2